MRERTGDMLQRASSYAPSQGVPDACFSERYEAVRDLEQYLGDPNDPTRPFSFSRSLACDEKDVYPQSAENAIRGWGAAEYLIPAALGGKLGDMEQALAVLRTIARRDVTVAVSFGANLLAALPVWIAGDASGLRLTGEKWLISKARKARAVMVFARTLPKGGPRGFSLFLLDKQSLPQEQWTTLPAVTTVGLRGADISGLRFRRCSIPEGSLVGETGYAYETLHRTLTVTKVFCGALALGAADTALRIVVGFAVRRRLYGGSALNIPHVRAQLCGAFLDILVCECVAHAAARALGDPDEPSLFWSALVKYYVPTVVERVLQSLGVVLGARFFLREGPEGYFQKIVRDASIVSVFEGNTAVNLGILASQLTRRPMVQPGSVADAQRRVRNLFSLFGDCASMTPAALSLRPLGFNAVVAALPEDDELETPLPGWQLGSSSAPRLIRAAIRRLKFRIRSWEESTLALVDQYDGHPHRQSTRLLDLVGDYCRFHAAASCWHVWRYCPPTTDEFLGRGDWLALCLRRLLSRPGAAMPWCAASENVFGELLRRWKEGRPFSLTST